MLVSTGGVIPSVAGDLHRKHLNDVTNEALYQSNVDIKVEMYSQ